MMNRLKQLYWNWLAGRATQPQLGQRITPHDWMDAVEAYLPIERDRTVIIDGGANHGRVAVELAERFRGAIVHGFEPIAEVAQKAQDRLGDRPGRIHAMALSDRSGTIPFNVNAGLATSSALVPGSYNRQHHADNVRAVEQREVPAVSLDDWVADSGLDSIDLLKLDLQGYELNALRGAERLLAERRIRCILTEVTFVPLYENAPLFGDLDRHLRERGYDLLNLYELWTLHETRQISCCDALYVPREAIAARAAA